MVVNPPAVSAGSAFPAFCVVTLVLTGIFLHLRIIVGVFALIGEIAVLFLLLVRL